MPAPAIRSVRRKAIRIIGPPTVLVLIIVQIMTNKLAARVTESTGTLPVRLTFMMMIAMAPAPVPWLIMPLVLVPVIIMTKMEIELLMTAVPWWLPVLLKT